MGKADEVFTCGLGEQLQGLQAMLVLEPSSFVKSYMEVRRMTRGMLSLSQDVSSALELGVWGVASPPPVVPAARPNGVPTAIVFGRSDATAARAKTRVGRNMTEQGV